MEMNRLLEWLNDEPPVGPMMQRDEGFAMMSWRDIQINKQGKGLSARTFLCMSVVALGLPLMWMR